LRVADFPWVIGKVIAHGKGIWIYLLAGRGRVPVKTLAIEIAREGDNSQVHKAALAYPIVL
jgi:hypothetical protein